MNHLVWCLVVSFLVVLFILPYWIKKAKTANLTGEDIHKVNKRSVAEMGGVIVLLGFLVGVLSYVAIKIFFFQANTYITSILAILTSILIAGTIGVMDDILGWKIGLLQWQKPLLTLLVAAPIMAINSGSSTMLIIHAIEKVNIGMFYPLIIIPLLILIGTNGFNMLAGYNGLETGQGILILSTLAWISYSTGSAWLTIVALCMVFALLGFWIYNKFPAKVFPGDTLTYTVGALIAIISIIGDFERAFLVLFIPYIFEFILKLGGRFKKESFAQVKENGTLVPRYKKSYGLEHLAIKLLNKLKVKTTERKVVYLLHLFQIIFVAITLYLYG